jgi:two-component sensor histidine kinase
MLKGIQETARTMGLVYEQLYQSENLSEVGMEHYLNDLVANVVDAFGGRRQIELNLECEDIRLDLGTAMPCGLMVNELLTNALKYAFPPSFQGAPKLMISLKARDNRCDLLVGDNGVGLPEGMEQRTPRSMGLRLVKLWATHQMGGTLEVESGDGTTYHITFPTRNK